MLTDTIKLCLIFLLLTILQQTNCDGPMVENISQSSSTSPEPPKEKNPYYPDLKNQRKPLVDTTGNKASYAMEAGNEKNPYIPDLKNRAKHLSDPIPKLGDLVLTRSQSLEMFKNSFDLSRYRWEERTVPVEISRKFTAREKLAIWFALDMIEENTCIRFISRRYIDINFVYITKDVTKPIASRLGKVGGAQVVNLHLADRYDILHEFMHTLGIPHQHSVSRRDDFIKINWENIPTIFKGQFTKFGERTNYEYLNDYDLNSIMHYDVFAGGKNGVSTLEGRSGPIQPSAIPTQKDYMKLNALYECDKYMDM